MLNVNRCLFLLLVSEQARQWFEITSLKLSFTSYFFLRGCVQQQNCFIVLVEIQNARIDEQCTGMIDYSWRRGRRREEDVTMCRIQYSHNQYSHSTSHSIVHSYESFSVPYYRCMNDILVLN